MQEKQGSTKLHDSLMQSTDMYKKMFNMLFNYGINSLKIYILFIKISILL
jgi:hypothetical protein